MKSPVCKCQSAVDYAKDYVKRLTDLLNSLDYAEIDRVVELLIDARDRGATIFSWAMGGAPLLLPILPMIWEFAHLWKAKSLSGLSVSRRTWRM